MFYKASLSAVKSTAMIFFIIIGAQIFTMLIAKSGISRGMIKWFVSINPSPFTFFLFICLVYLILGCLMDGVSIVYLTIPLLFPLVLAIGFDAIWFGVILVVLTEVAMLTPPIGMNLFVLMSITNKTISFTDIVWGCFPFVFLYLILLFILYFFPTVATWLPSTM